TRWHEDDLAGRLLAEPDPTRGLDCGYSRENAELSSDINMARRTLFRHLPPRRPPARRSATTRTVQKTRSRFRNGNAPGDRFARTRNMLAASDTTELAARFGRGLLLGGYLKPRQPCASRDAGACVERAADPLNAVRARLDSEQLRVAPRTSRPLRGRLIVRQTDCVGPSAGGGGFRGAHPRRGGKPP